MSTATKRKYYVYGAGGLGRELQAYLTASLIGSDAHPVVLVDANPALPEVIAHDQLLEAHKQGLVEGLWIAVGTPTARQSIYARCAEDGFPMPAFLADSVKRYARTTVRQAAILCDNCVITCDATIEENVFINLNCTIGHDAVIGAHSVVNPGCNISGNVTIGKACLIGTGATILQGVQIGDGATVGAGAVVTKEIPNGETWIGVPARPK